MSHTVSTIEAHLRIILSEDVVQLIMKADSVDELGLLALLLAKSLELNQPSIRNIDENQRTSGVGTTVWRNPALMAQRLHEQNSRAED